MTAKPKKPSNAETVAALIVTLEEAEKLSAAFPVQRIRWWHFGSISVDAQRELTLDRRITDALALARQIRTRGPKGGGL